MLEIKLPGNTCKNATLLSYLYAHHLFFFFSLILPKPTIPEAIKLLYAEKELILIQKGLSLIFKDAG